MLNPPISSNDQLESHRLRAIEIFRERRMREPLEEYLSAFDRYLGIVEELLEKTVDLTQVDANALEILTDGNLLEAFRYLVGPPISKDDLKVLIEGHLSAKAMRRDPELVRRIVEIVRSGLDRRRFPWIAENREPSEPEKSGAALASAALMATRALETRRRTEDKDLQESAVCEALRGAGLTQVNARPIKVISQAPGVGEFCTESLVGGRKADIIVRLWDERILPIECKVSNSATNSVKRLNNDAAQKATVWLDEFGKRLIVPAAVLSGVYNLQNLQDAQSRGLALFWDHALNDLADWIRSTA